MSSINKVQILGNLGRDPEIRYTQDGKKIANLNIATSETWKDKQTSEKRERTEWHRVVCFNPGLCDVIENYLAKGSKVYVEGQLQTRKWQDQSGQDRYTTEVVLKPFKGELVILSGKNSGQSQGDYSASDYAAAKGRESGGGDYPASADQDAGDPGDDIPFISAYGAW